MPFRETDGTQEILGNGALRCRYQRFVPYLKFFFILLNSNECTKHSLFDKNGVLAMSFPSFGYSLFNLFPFFMR